MRQNRLSNDSTTSRGQSPNSICDHTANTSSSDKKEYPSKDLLNLLGIEIVSQCETESYNGGGSGTFESSNNVLNNPIQKSHQDSCALNLEKMVSNQIGNTRNTRDTNRLESANDSDNKSLMTQARRQSLESCDSQNTSNSTKSSKSSSSSSTSSSTSSTTSSSSSSSSSSSKKSINKRKSSIQKDAKSNNAVINQNEGCKAPENKHILHNEIMNGANQAKLPVALIDGKIQTLKQVSILAF